MFISHLLKTERARFSAYFPPVVQSSRPLCELNFSYKIFIVSYKHVWTWYDVLKEGCVYQFKKQEIPDRTDEAQFVFYTHPVLRTLLYYSSHLYVICVYDEKSELIC